MKTELEDIQTMQQQRISYSSRLRSNITATMNNLTSEISNLTDGIHRLDRKLNSTQENQLILTSQVTNFTNEFKLIDQQIEEVQQKQNELSNLSEGSGQEINILSTNLTDEIQRLDEKWNSTNEKQLELTSRLKDHGHGNKHRIDQLEKKIGVLWINFLDSRNLISPILQKYGKTYGETIGVKNTTKNKALRKEIERLDVNETTEYKRIVTDRIPSSPSVKLTPIDGNKKKVKTVSFYYFLEM